MGASAPGFEDYVNALKHDARRMGVDHAVTWLGHQPAERIAPLLQAADICVLPYAQGLTSKHTSFATAASSGVPIITTYGPSSPRQLFNLFPDSHVTFVSAGSESALTEAVAKISKESGMADDGSRNSTPLVELYSPEHTVRQLLRLTMAQAQ
jgi:glycosyltransferase involved in cell wall biosynthesis